MLNIYEKFSRNYKNVIIIVHFEYKFVQTKQL